MPEKRKFFEVELPLINHKADLIGNSIEDLNNRSVKLDLTRKLRGKSLEMLFKINVKDKKAEAIPKQLRLFLFYLRRAMRKSIDYVEDSFSAECANCILKVKYFLITRKKVSRSVRNALRIKAKEEILAGIKDKKYEDVFLEILSGKFQKDLSLKLKKTYPLAFCEIKDIYVEK